jgi:6-pyruvoyltetrahydropterin/6-carboxytetrahydropterin synthase
MKVQISKEFDFDAAHFLPGVPDGHKCKRMHGHTYRAEVWLEGEVNPANGMLVDYAAIAVVWESVHRLLDHRVLNEIPGLEHPTTEVVAPLILRLMRDGGCLPVTEVRLFESSTTSCRVLSRDVPADPPAVTP